MSALALPSRAAAPARRLYETLLGGFLYYTFIGLHPLSETSPSARAEGSPADRLAVLALLALALVVLWRRRAAAWACLAGNAGQIALVGLALVSAFWSDFPDLTLRRAMLFVFLTIIVLALAAGVEDLRRFHTFLFVALTLVIGANVLAMGLAPGRAISDIGVNGLYGQKNQAGIVAMIAAVVGFSWLLGASRARETARGAAALGLIFAFLILTRSKTSINLTLIGVALMSFFALAERFGPRFILAAVAGGLMASAALLVALTAVDFDVGALVNSVVADTTFTGRDQLWAFSTSEAQKRYWLGHGYGAFWDVGYANDPILRVETGSWLATTGIGVINQAHNGYLELWLELGLPAAVLAGLTTLKGALAGSYRAVASARPRAERAALAGFSVLLALQLLHNFTEATLFMRGLPFASVASLALFVLARAR